MRESRHRRDRISDKTAKKEDFFGGGSLRFFFQKWPAHPVFSGNFLFFGRGKTNFFWGGGYEFKTG